VTESLWFGSYSPGPCVFRHSVVSITAGCRLDCTGLICVIEDVDMLDRTVYCTCSAGLKAIRYCDCLGSCAGVLVETLVFNADVYNYFWEPSPSHPILL